MNISGLSNHIQFNNIFESCRNSKKKIDWVAVASYPDLPMDLIDQYYNKLRFYLFEQYQTLNEFILKKYKNTLNWYLIFNHQNIDEDILINIEDIICKKNLWSLLFKTQKLSLNYLINHIDLFKENENLFKNSLKKNYKIDDSIKLQIQFLLE